VFFFIFHIEDFQKKIFFFYQNDSSKQESKDYILSTGVEQLSVVLDRIKFIRVPAGIMSSVAGITSGQAVQMSNDDYNTSITSPLSKPKLILSKNNYFKDTLVLEGSNYSVYRTDYNLVNNIFYSKLQPFNSYYIVKTKDPASAILPIIQPQFSEELNYNIPTKYLNRTMIESSVKTNIDQL